MDNPTCRFRIGDNLLAYLRSPTLAEDLGVLNTDLCNKKVGVAKLEKIRTAGFVLCNSAKTSSDQVFLTRLHITFLNDIAYFIAKMKAKESERQQYYALQQLVVCLKEMIDRIKRSAENEKRKMTIAMKPFFDAMYKDYYCRYMTAHPQTTTEQE